MNTYLVAVVDGTTARFLTLKPVALPEYESGPKLVELDGLFTGEKEQSGAELWTTTKPGRNRGTLGQAHGYDDHREQHMAEFSRRFAQSVAHRIDELLKTHGANSLVLVAEPQILGLLRDAIAPVLPESVMMQDLAKDLCALKPHELQNYLAKQDLLPAYRSVLPS
jgi:protein required for attachment to host cells